MAVMKYVHFDYAGRPARIMTDAEDVPESCEVWNTAQKKFVRDDSFTLDVMNAYESRIISAEEFAALLAKVQQNA
jgi:hypothetical protein